MGITNYLGMSKEELINSIRELEQENTRLRNENLFLSAWKNDKDRSRGYDNFVIKSTNTQNSLSLEILKERHREEFINIFLDLNKRCKK